MTLPQMGCQSITGLPQYYIHWYQFIQQGGERHFENKSVLPKDTTQCPQPGLQPEPLNPPLQCRVHVRKMQTVMLHADVNNQNSVSILVLL